MKTKKYEKRKMKKKEKRKQLLVFLTGTDCTKSL